MAGHMNAGQTLYTVEQIELIRRLRNSGMNKEQLVAAFDSFERLDRELGHIYTIPMSLAAAGMPVPGMMNMPPMLTHMHMSRAAQAVSQAMSKLAAAAQTPQAQAPSRKRSHDEDPSESSTPELPTLPLPMPQPQMNGIHSLASVANGAEEVDGIEESEEFREFVGKGEISCCEEIRNFVIQYNIKQQQVAVCAGISQSYVSRYLKGDHYDMSERSRRAIKKWYIIFRSNPAAVGPAANMAMLSAPPTPAKLQKFAEQTKVNEFVNYPRRERFVFRPAHLQVLERYFQDDSYPSQEKRDEISRACNAVVEIPAGRPLVERETVTPQIISNWFANKRKEMKKLAREEGLEISPMRGRGRPARISMDFAAAMMHENGPGQMGLHMTNSIPGFLHGENSNPSPIIPGTSGDSSSPTIATPSQASTPSSPPHTPIDEATLTKAPNVAGSQPQSTPTNPPTAPEMSPQGSPDPPNTVVVTPSHPMSIPSAADVKTSLNLEAADDQSLSLAVEMAAVNQAIIALSGQNPIGIKTEACETTVVAPVSQDNGT